MISRLNFHRHRYLAWYARKDTYNSVLAANHPDSYLKPGKRYAPPWCYHLVMHDSEYVYRFGITYLLKFDISLFDDAIPDQIREVHIVGMHSNFVYHFFIAIPMRVILTIRLHTIRIHTRISRRIVHEVIKGTRQNQHHNCRQHHAFIQNRPLYTTR